MPWLQPGGVGGAFGFVPHSADSGEQAAVHMYIVSSSEGQIFPGDVMTLSSIQGGNAPMARLCSSAAGVLPIVGIAAAGLGANAGSSGTLVLTQSSQMVPIYDSPDQQFYSQDTTSGLVGSTGMMKNVQFSATGAGSTATNRSGMFIAGNTASSGLSYAFKLLGLHPIDAVNGPSSAGAGTGTSTDKRIWIVKPLNHTYAQQGVVLLTT